MTFSTLRALHAVIGTAIDDIEHVYHKRSQGTPLEYPSLDDAYYYTGQHTPEEELAETLKDDPAVLMASMRIVGACGQLSITVNKPWFGLMENAMRGQFASAIRFLETANIVEILRGAGPGGLHVQEIHRQIFELRTNLKSASPVEKTPLTPESLSHILRLLATGHYLREVTPDVFANNRASSYIDTGKTVAQLRKAPEMKYHDTDGVAAFVAMLGDEALKMISSLSEWALPTEKRAPGTHFDPRSPNGLSQEKAQAPEDGGQRAVTRYLAPFNLAFETQLGYFQWLELPENEGRFVRFGHSMAGWRQCELKDQILRAFAWDTLPQGAVLVDVGGGIGAQSVLVAQAHPHIRVVVEDRAQVVAASALAWGPQHAELFRSGRMSWRTRNFFEPWAPLALPPALGGVDAAPAVFLLRLILHDWKDEDCESILRQLRAAAGPDTKLLVGDMLLQHACADDAAYAESAQAAAAAAAAFKFPFVTRASPLLPNLGLANSLGYLLDILMMGLFDAKERTVDEMGTLLLSTGWKIVEIRRTPGSMWAYTTAVPV